MNELQPPQKVLLRPGPSTVHPRVLQALSLPVMGHLAPAFFQVMDDVCAMLRLVFHTENSMTVPISSPGTGAMETACANIIEPIITPVCLAGLTRHPINDVDRQSWTW